VQLPDDSLFLQRVELGDAGLYTCVAQNAFGSAQRHVRVRVTGLGNLLFLDGFAFFKFYLINQFLIK
jgi:hypothetical protein